MKATDRLRLGRLVDPTQSRGGTVLGASSAVRRAAAATVGTAILALALASCSSSPSGSGTTTTTSATTTTTAASSTTSSTAAGPTNCTTAELSVTLGMGSGAAGTIGQVILFKNQATVTCLLHGFPGVAGLDNAGNQITQATREVNNVPFSGSTASLPTVSLSPGLTASALVLGSDVPEGTATSCVSYAGLLVTPPNAFQSVKLTVTMPGCAGLRVGPVYSGTTGMSS
jgi:hypothetical protein